MLLNQSSAILPFHSHYLVELYKGYYFSPQEDEIANFDIYCHVDYITEHNLHIMQYLQIAKTVISNKTYDETIPANLVLVDSSPLEY